MTQCRVLILFSTSELGGAERSLTRMVKASKSVEYQLATLAGNGPWSDWARTLGLQPLMFGASANQSEKLSLTAFIRVVRYLRKDPPDILYVCGVLASFFLRLCRPLLPQLYLIHGVRSNLNSSSNLDKFFRIMESWTHKLVDAWITNSRAARETLITACRIPEAKVSVIYNGLEHLPKGVIPLRDRPIEILTVANLSPRKGYKEYLEVIRQVVNAYPEARFVFVGRDDMDGEIQAAIADAGLSDFVRWDGFQTDVSQWYQHARVFVLPSLWGEGSPTSILEAFSFNVPVIAYSNDGIPELVSDSVDGYLVANNNRNLLAAKILSLLKNIQVAQAFGDAGRIKIEQRFTLEKCAVNHASFFLELLKKTSKQKI